MFERQPKTSNEFDKFISFDSNNQFATVPDIRLTPDMDDALNLNGLTSENLYTLFSDNLSTWQDQGLEHPSKQGYQEETHGYTYEQPSVQKSYLFGSPVSCKKSPSPSIRRKKSSFSGCKTLVNKQHTNDGYDKWSKSYYERLIEHQKQEQGLIQMSEDYDKILTERNSRIMTLENEIDKQRLETNQLKKILIENLGSVRSLLLELRRTNR